MKERGQITIEAIVALAVFIVIIGGWLSVGIKANEELAIKKADLNVFSSVRECSWIIDEIFIEGGIFEFGKRCPFLNIITSGS